MQAQLSNDFKKIAFFSALCAFLSLIEFAVPKPLPFMRIGFANMSIMLSLFALNFPQGLLLVLIKVFIQALISGTLISYVFLFSLSASLASYFFMQAAKNIFKNHISFIGLALAGSLGNNLAQISLSYAIIFKSSTSYIAPVLLISGLVSALILGFLTQLFADKSVWFKNICQEKELSLTDNLSGSDALLERKKFSWKSFGLQFGRDLLLFIFIVFFSLLIPSGKVLFSIADFEITQSALFLGMKRALILILSVQLSKIIIPRKIVFKGKTGIFINLILLYFRLLSQVEIPKKKDAEKQFLLRLDKYLVKICYD
ncbi:MAG: Gx transporter family protein [Treponemataceae bacterium]|nr:Gx transporter family protein [Treponemataceae bacterium]